MIAGLSMEVLAAFVAACVFLAATPGPSMSFFMANTASFGMRAGLLSVLGNTIGLMLIVTVAVLGVRSVMALVAEWFDVIRWVGVAYLIYLGIRRLMSAYHGDDAALAVPPTDRRIVSQAAFIALSNPKVLLFLGAFFPQFLNPVMPAGPQLVLLAVAFVLTIVLTDAALVLLASRARVLLTRRGRRVTDAISGSILLGGGALLAVVRR